MKLDEYASYDGLGLAELVARKQVSAKELAQTALSAIERADGKLKSVVEIYHDRIGDLDVNSLGSGPFHGVPFLMKDVFGHEKGRKIEFGSRLCKGMVADTGTYFLDHLKAAGLNIVGRSAAPEYSMAATTESALYGNTSNPWKFGYSAGGSSGGAQAAVTAGLVPLAHGSDIGGSIRIPASFCGGVGLKPSRGRVSIGPVVDEGGFGYSANLVQAKSVRDVAALLDCVSAPMPGDPFIIPKPTGNYAELAMRAPPKLRIGMILNEIVGAAIDPEVARAVESTGRLLADLGHLVEPVTVDMGGAEVLDATTDLFFFGFDSRLEGYAKRSGHKIGPDTLEPVILAMYEYAKTISPAKFMASWGAANVARRKLGAFWAKHDIWLSPTTARVAEPWGNYNLSKPGIGAKHLSRDLFKIPVQFTIPHNIMGTPAMSLPLAMHSSGLPIGIQIAAGPANEHTVLQIASALERSRPWAGRIPSLHVSNV